MRGVRRKLGFGVIGALFLGYAGIVGVGLVVLAAAGASLTVFLGHVDVQRTSGGGLAAGHSGDQLHAGDTVRTSAATKASVGYPDGSLTRLDSNSMLQVRNIASSGSGVWNLELLQTSGKLWNRVNTLATGSSFKVDAPDSTTVEVRGTEFEVLVDPQGGSVRVDSWSGAVDVTANGQKVSLTGGQSTSVQRGSGPTAAAPISDADRNDPFTSFNQALDAAQGPVLNLFDGTLNQGQTSQIQQAGFADGNTDLVLTLGWPGSKLELTPIEPTGAGLHAVSSDQPPLTVVIAKAKQGAWAYTVRDIESKPQEPYWVIVTWRVRPANVAAAEKGLNDWSFSHQSTESDIVSYEQGPLLKMDQAGLRLVSIFKGDPVRMIYVSGEFTVDPTAAQLYVPPPAQSSLGFLVSSPITFAKDPAHSKGEALVVFNPTSSGQWEASTMGFIPDGTLPPALAVGGDGYTIPATFADSGRYLVPSGQLSAAIAADVEARVKGGGDPRFANDSSLASFAKSVVDSEGFYKQHFNWKETDQFAASVYPTYAFNLADGSLLELVTITDTIILAAPPGGCVVQPTPFYYEGGQRYYSLMYGPVRGTYAGVNQTSLVTFAVVVPPKSSGKTVRYLGGRSLIVDWSTTPCQYRATSGPGTGDIAYI